MNLALWLERTAKVHGTRPAIFSGDVQVHDYTSFFRASLGLSAALGARGIAPGDRVALFMRNCPEYLLGFYGAWAAGAGVVPINAKLHAKEAAYILENSGAKLALVTPELGAELAKVSDLPMVDVTSDDFTAMCAHAPRDIIPRTDGDLAWLFYTSGTTGRPKGVFISHGMIRATSLSFLLDCDQVQPEDAAFYMAPMSHGAGIYAPIHVAKAARHITPASGGFDEMELLQAAETQGPLSMFMAPTMVRRLTDVAKAAGKRGEGIKTIIYGGGPMYLADITDAVDWFGPRFAQIYGQGECPMAITALSREEVADRSHPRWRERLASVGRAQSVVEVMIGDEDGQPLPIGDVGEIMVRGTPVMPGYWQNPKATEKTLVGGWLMTGDMGYLDEDGYLTMRDRSKDVIISGGTNIYPREVEEALLTHPMVHEVSVVGRPNDEWGEDVVAYVVPASGSSPDAAELDAHCLAQIARFKRPKTYFWLSELPKNNYGKVLKTELRRKLQGSD
ncbi:class I adenylate-forming enzyme family protein [Aliiroseovarius lamellibrachiae]|uniref:class I adenylate-forming enzyme family protein n=1 Tax=Aliiroseovarius lamellibrachiae TaxID=1924933 RepID=UPI001BE0B0BE|nr:AMP-binding protein [Aliiroseovarius lamellibrachiae]MBT2130068.1 AMP-binding protein [Aliiroseovarius lamellibrachiae]